MKLTIPCYLLRSRWRGAKEAEGGPEGGGGEAEEQRERRMVSSGRDKRGDYR